MNSLRKYDKVASLSEDAASTFDLIGTVDLLLETIKKSISTAGKDMDSVFYHLRK